MTPTLTRQKAGAHEALYPELERLTRQLEAMAVKRPGAPVPPATSAIAADLLFEAQSFGWNRAGRTRRALPEPAADVGGLASQLGQALALLDAFEAAHAAWEPELKCFVWIAPVSLPVRRLRPEPVRPPKSAGSSRRVEELRRKIAARLEELNQGA